MNLKRSLAATALAATLVATSVAPAQAAPSAAQPAPPPVITGQLQHAFLVTEPTAVRETRVRWSRT